MAKKRKQNKKSSKKNTLAANIIPLREVDLILEVNCDAFNGAKQLNELGLWVTHVLSTKTNTVMGWCTNLAKDKIVACPCVKSWEVNS